MAAIINKLVKLSLMSSCVAWLCACSSQPVATTVAPAATSKPQIYTSPTGVIITPYDVEPIIRQSL